MASASYITGSHAIKAGMTMQWGTNSRTFSSNAQINTLVFNTGLLGAPPSATNPVPCIGLPCPLAVAVQQRSGDARSRRSTATSASSCRTPGRINRLTLNLGGRFDHFNAEVPAQSSPAGNLDPGARLRRDPERAELERLVGPPGRRL